MSENSPPNSPSPAALDLSAIAAWCRTAGVPFGLAEDGSQLAIPRGGEDVAPLRVIERKDAGVLTLAIVVARGLPERQWAAVSDVCAQANARMYSGAWVLNKDNGQLYLRMSAPTVGVAWTDEGIRRMIHVTLGTAEAILPQLRAVLLPK